MSTNVIYSFELMRCIRGPLDVNLVMGIALSIFSRIISRLSLLKRRNSETQLDTDSKKTSVDASRCCNDLTCTNAAKTAKELLTKMEQIQTQLQNEVILWKFRFIRGICTEENRKHFYELLRQFTTYNGMLDTVIERETKYLDAMQPKQSENAGSAKVQTKETKNAAPYENKVNQNKETADVEAHKPRGTASKEKPLQKRRTFFAKVHERNVKLLLLALNEVDECRSMIATTCNGHELSLGQEGTSIKSLGVLEESNEEQQPETRRQQEAVMFLPI